MSNELEKLIHDEAEHGELTRSDPLLAGSPGERRNQAKSVVYSVRLSPADVARVELLAEQRGIPASALVRGFVLRGLSEQDPTSPGSTLDRVAADVRRLQDMLSR